MADEWVAHPNRSALGPNTSGRNGHYRSPRGERSRLPQETCQARVGLPPNLSQVCDPDGTATFSGPDWSFVAGAARSFARQYMDGKLLPPFGFKDGRAWTWWDGTQTAESILEGADACDHVRRYLEKLFPHAGSIEISDRR
ncbi:Uncharacterised protein [Mycobacteroides abscessus subsp. abscessus]|uniref:hypothetical protein n=1 Tax=Mycobacteroides abscessus TaxID=36809 RepID=UPI0009298903|nr:hypothetical protein [Mycobacteroides abscessus]SIJ22432.1 Uncharacterised protein [Mycobacteroides abscessus subsp. abscessus]SLH38330.1 Uncharacterised protein [Mycobacteroides abscessus subsp. abscessus]